MKTKEVILLIGPPGAGKSTWIRLSGLREHVVCSTDDIFVQKGAEIGMSYDQAFDHFSFKEVEKEFKNNIRAAAERGASVIIDRTNLTRKARAKMLNYFDKSYRRVFVLFEFSNRELLEARIEKRRTSDGKSISKKTLDDMLAMYNEPASTEYDEIIRVNFLK